MDAPAPQRRKRRSRTAQDPPKKPGAVLNVLWARALAAWACCWRPPNGQNPLARPLPRKTLVLDLDETLIQSTSRGAKHFQFLIEVMIDRRACLYYTYKRPYVDEFLRVAASWYTIAVYTASMSEYADPVIDFLEASCSSANIGPFERHYYPAFARDDVSRYEPAPLRAPSTTLGGLSRRCGAATAHLARASVRPAYCVAFFVFTLLPFATVIVPLLLAAVRTAAAHRGGHAHVAAAASLRPAATSGRRSRRRAAGSAHSSSSNTPAASDIDDPPAGPPPALPHTLISARYFRDACIRQNASYIKDLPLVNPNLGQVALVDNSPNSYALHQDNGIPISGWINDPSDEGLLELIPFLDALRFVEDVRSILSLRA